MNSATANGVENTQEPFDMTEMRQNLPAEAAGPGRGAPVNRKGPMPLNKGVVRAPRVPARQTARSERYRITRERSPDTPRPQPPQTGRNPRPDDSVGSAYAPASTYSSGSRPPNRRERRSAAKAPSVRPGLNATYIPDVVLESDSLISETPQEVFGIPTECTPAQKHALKRLYKNTEDDHGAEAHMIVSKSAALLVSDFFCISMGDRYFVLDDPSGFVFPPNAQVHVCLDPSLMSNAISTPDYSHCRHAIHECNCMPECDVFFAATGFQRFPLTMLRALIAKSRLAFFGCYHTPDIAGSINGGEIVYTRPSPQTITYTAGLVSLEATPHDWLHHGCAYIDDGPSLVSKLCRRAADVCLYQVVSSVVPPPPVHTLRSALSTQSPGFLQSLPPITGESRVVADAHFETILLPRLFHWGNILFTCGEVKTQFVISKPILSSVAILAIGMPRDQVTYSVLLSAAKQQYATRCQHLDPMSQTRAVSATASLALYLTLQEETQLATMNARTYSHLDQGTRSHAVSLDLRLAALNVAAGVGVAAIGIFGLYYTGSRIITRTKRNSGGLLPASLNVAIPLLAPFYEERLKRWAARIMTGTKPEDPVPLGALASVGAAFGIYEAYVNASLTGLPEFVMRLGSTAPLHVAWTMLPEAWGMLLHFIHNSFVVSPLIWPQAFISVLQTYLDLFGCNELSSHYIHSLVPNGSHFADLADRYPLPPSASLFHWLSVKGHALVEAMFGVGGLAATVIKHWWISEVAPDLPEIVHMPPVTYLGHTNDFAEPKYPVEEGVVIKRVFQPNPKLRAPKLRLVGVGIHGIAPSVYLSTPEAELLAIEQRLVIQRPDSDLDRWDEAHQRMINSIAWRLIMTKAPFDYTSDACFENWVSRYPTLTKRQALKDARIRIKGRPLAGREWKRSLFVKSEIRMELTPTGPNRGHPRAIVAGSDELLAKCGPFFWRLGQQMQKVWNEDSPVLFGAASAEVIGKWHDNWVAKLGPEVYYRWGDFSRMDGHSSEQSLDSERDMYTRVGLSGSELETLDGMREATVVTTQGWRVETSDRRLSGEPQTSVGNTLETVLVTQDALVTQEKEYTLGTDYALAAAGDDDINISALDCHVSLEEMTARSLQLGYRVKYEESRNKSDAEFCSKLFYPTPDGTVVGPKLGKIIAKIGWILEKPSSDYRTVIQCDLDDCYHIPFVRELLQKTLDLLPPTQSKRRKIVDMYDYRIHVSQRHDWCEETWVFLYQRYRLTRAEHASFVEMLRHVHSLPCLVPVPWMQRCLERDS